MTHLEEGISLSTEEYEYVVFTISMHDLLSFKRRVQVIFTGVEID